MSQQQSCPSSLSTCPPCPTAATTTTTTFYHSKLYMETILIIGILLGCFITTSSPTIAYHVERIKTWLFDRMMMMVAWMQQKHGLVKNTKKEEKGAVEEGEVQKTFIVTATNNNKNENNNSKNNNHNLRKNGREQDERNNHAISNLKREKSETRIDDVLSNHRCNSSSRSSRSSSSVCSQSNRSSRSSQSNQPTTTTDECSSNSTPKPTMEQSFSESSLCTQQSDTTSTTTTTTHCDDQVSKDDDDTRIGSNSNSIITTTARSSRRSHRNKDNSKTHQRLGAEYEVLKSAVELFMKQWNIMDDHDYDDHDDHDNLNPNNRNDNNDLNDHDDQHQYHRGKKLYNEKVVDYISPRDMVNTYFNRSSSTSTTTTSTTTNTHSQNIDDDISNSMCLSIERNTDTNTDPTHTSISQQQQQEQQQISTKQIIHLFQQIHKYSVQTSHPFFFNQLFGALDPIALSAEVLALTIHTSAYTWETAPFVSLIEREVMIRLGQLVFERNLCVDDDDDRDDIDLHYHNDIVEEENVDDAYHEMLHYKYDGLMLPGGSLSNLTALHLARHYYLHGNKPIHYDENDKNSSYNTSTIHNPDYETFLVDDDDDNNNDYSDKTDTDTPEKKVTLHHSCTLDRSTIPNETKKEPRLIAFVSNESHYSFQKAASVTGMGRENLISVRTLPNGQMDVHHLDDLLSQFYHHHNEDTNSVPFFVAATSGSTVRGSFDDIEAIVHVCKKHEDRLNSTETTTTNNNSKCNGRRRSKIWIHVDGAWGGSAIFSSRKDMKQLMKGVQYVDSFTFNPHKLLGAPQQTTAFISRHKGISKAVNSCKSKYLFDERKNGAEFDIGDGTFTCGRKADALKLWSMWKYYGTTGISQQVERKVDSLHSFVQMIKDHDSFMLACTPWPFNVNFFYLPDRLKVMLQKYGIDTREENPLLPDEISDELAKVSVGLKLKLHQSGEMFVPYQPLSNQKADCFRLVLAGNKVFELQDFERIMELMQKFGKSL